MLSLVNTPLLVSLRPETHVKFRRYTVQGYILVYGYQFLFGKNVLSPSSEQSKKGFISLLIVNDSKSAQQCIW